MTLRAHLVGFAVGLAAMPAVAASGDDLRAALAHRFEGDRTGACVAAALIDNGKTERAYFCADPKSARRYDEHTAFEIGSITKTMTAALLAEFIARGEMTLDDPIAKLLPPGTSVPAFEGREITIRHIVTHTSGLPSFPWAGATGPNPYAALTERDLLGVLAATKLTRAPGTQTEYSNFAMMLLSYALARRSGKDYETLLHERVLVPLGMNDTYITKRPAGVSVAQGHLSTGKPTGPWDFQVDMAGVGGVRATLPDMVRYLEGELGTRESAITPALARTQERVPTASTHVMGMTWNLPAVTGYKIVEHSGGTGGFSSFAAFDREAKRGVVLLSDTSLVALGGLRRLGLHLLGSSVLPEGPRTVAVADAKLIDALVGRYRLRNGLTAELRRKGDVLFVQAAGQPEFELGYDSAGDFYPLAFDALLRPRRKSDGTYALTWFQLGAALAATRIDAPARAANKWTPSEGELKEYEGSYPLAPTFALRVFATGPKLFVQGTNQPAIECAAADKDICVADNVSAEIDFERDTGGKVVALTLKQRGLVLRGERK